MRFFPTALLLAVSFPASFLVGQGQSEGPGTPVSRPASPALLTAFDAVTAMEQELSLPPTGSASFRVDVVIGGEVRQLRLDPYDVRSPRFQLLVQDDVGVHRVPSPPSVTYRGHVVGAPDSRVAASLTDQGLRAQIWLPSDEGSWAIQPVREVDPAAPRRLHVGHHSGDVVPGPHRCGLVTPHAHNETPVARGPDNPAITDAELACDADYPFYQRNGSSVSGTQNDITAVINAVDVIYQRDVMIRHQIVTILVRTTSNEPYSTRDPGGLLSQFRSEWNTSQSGVHRDVAHLFTGRNLSGSVIGIAYLGVLCQVQGAYALSESRFTSNMNSRVGLTAHELGHNWDANHCDGDPDCYIMCSGLGGCSRNLTSFGSASVGAISLHRDTRLCLSLPPPPPQITSMTPAAGPAFRPGVVTLTGSGFRISTGMQWGALTLTAPTDYQVVSDNTIVLAPPTPTGLGQVAVAVSGPGGTSNAVGYDYHVTSPPGLHAPGGALGGLTLRFEFGGVPSNHWYLLVSLDSRTAPLSGVQLLLGSSILSIGILDPAVGLGSYTIPIPPGLLNGWTVYSQLLDLDPVTLLPVGTSSVGQTTFF